MPRSVGVTPKGYVVAVSLSGGTASKSTYVRLMNRSTLEYVDALASSNSVSLNAGDCSSDGTKEGTFSGFDNGDVLEVRAWGDRYGSTTHTVATGKGGGKVSLSVQDVSSSNTPGVEA